MKFSAVLFLCLAALVPHSSGGKTVGKIQTRISPRIVGGQSANAGEFPSAAAIYISNSFGTYFCGGSLISQEFVLTAANCIVGGVTFRIILGSTTLQGNDPNRLILSAAVHFFHPAFNPQTLENDIGLIKFYMPIEYTDYIKPVNLPTTELIDNMVNTAIGWGQISDDDAGLSNELRYATLTTISNAECQRSYTNTIFDTMVCVAGNYNEGTCLGDNGTPLLTILGLNQWIVGISSFISTNGCDSTDPSGFTRAFAYVDWIKTITGIP